MDTQDTQTKPNALEDDPPEDASAARRWQPIHDTALIASLDTLVRQSFGEDARVEHVAARKIHNVVSRFRVTVRRPGADDLVWPVIEKTFAHLDRAETSYRSQRLLIDAGFTADAEDAVSVPEPYLVLDNPPRLLMQDAGGDKVRGLLKTNDGPTYARLLARVILKLNRASIPGLPTYAVDSCLTQLEAARRKAGVLTGRLAAIVQSISDTGRTIAARDLALRPIHAGYHPGQLHYDGQRAWLLDTGKLSQGDPAFDAGRVLSVFDTSTDDFVDPGAVRTAFLDEYLAGTDSDVPSLLSFYEALNLAIRLCNRAGRAVPDDADPTLDVIESCLARTV